MASSIFKQEFKSIKVLAKSEYESCTFIGCDLSNTNVSGFIFEDCSFDACNLSLANLSQTALRSVKFKDCKLLGLQFDQCNPIGIAFTFTGCNLNNTSFFKVKAIGTKFQKCQMHEADFSQSDIRKSTFEDTDLLHAKFDQTNLEEVSFSTAYNYTLQPENNRLKKTRFSQSGIAGLVIHHSIIIEQ